MWLLEDHKRNVKGFWSIILTIPVLSIVTWYRNPQTLVTYTGGFCGAFILLIIPATVVTYARARKTEDLYGKNPNASPFGDGWTKVVWFWSAVVIGSVVYKTIKGGGGE